MNHEYTALAGRIRQSLLDLQRVVDRADFLLGQALQKDDDGYLDGVALNLHGFYGGVERIFEDIARSVDQSIPGGPEWHRDLLLQMANELVSVRPAVITSDTRHCLDEYRGFRHLVRKSCGVAIRRSKPTYKSLYACLNSRQQTLQTTDSSATCRYRRFPRSNIK
jgi:hypothetical protein